MENSDWGAMSHVGNVLIRTTAVKKMEPAYMVVLKVTMDPYAKHVSKM